MTQIPIGPRPLPLRKSQIVPFLILAAVNVAVGILFFQVVRPLLLPIFLAGVVALLVEPIHDRLATHVGGKRWLSASAFTILALVIIIGPLSIGAYFGVLQLSHGISRLNQMAAEDKLQPLLDPKTNPRLAESLEWLQEHGNIDLDQLRAWTLKVARGAGETVYRRTMDLLADLPGFVVGAFLFIFALYYFLAEGPQIIKGWETLSPLDAGHDRTIRMEFCKVCRGVVWATLAAALAQGLLVGLGLVAIDLIFDVSLGSWFFLIALATTVFSMVPFVGAFAVWGTVTMIFFYQGNYGAAITLALYGAIVVSAADNITKIVVLKGSANLHPLLAFICVFGGLDLFGVLGIFVGPIIGAVLVSLMRILKSELLNMSRSDDPAPPPVVPAPL